MAEFAAFPLWTDAYLVDTGDLSTIEHGAYLLILISMWRAGGYLPNRDDKLARCARLTPAKWRKVKPVIMEFLSVENDQITQGRLQEELEKARKRSTKAAQSARAKYRKYKKPPPANAEPEHCSESASISVSDSVKERTTNVVPKKAARGTRLPDDWKPTDKDVDWCRSKFHGTLTKSFVDQETEKFRNYWQAKSGQDATKLDWSKTWQNWIIRSVERLGIATVGRSTTRPKDALDFGYELAKEFEDATQRRQQSDQPPARQLSGPKSERDGS